MPPDSASAPQVVAAYLDALDAHDCDTAQAVASGEFAPEAEDWCQDVAQLTDVEVKTPTPENPTWLGFPSGTDGEFVSVAVTFDVDWRLLHSDGSMSEGPTSWGYVLVRASPDDRWLILDQGCC